MGSGMLWAALSGGANAGIKVLEDRDKRADEERKYERTTEEKRAHLMWEMKAKLMYARQEEAVEADAYERIDQRSRQLDGERGARELELARSTVPNEGEFANERITPEMIASLPPQARAIYEKDMGLTDDSALQIARDRMDAGRELGAPGSVRKELASSFSSEVKDARDRAERDRKERQDLLRQDGLDRRQLSSQEAAAARDSQRQAGILAAIAARGGGGGGGGSGASTSQLTSYLNSARGDLAARERALQNAKDSDIEAARGNKVRRAEIEAQFKREMAVVQQQRAELDLDYSAVRQQLFPQNVQAGKPAARSTDSKSTKGDNRTTAPASDQAVRSEAAAFIKKNPQLREQVLNDLRRDNIDTKGL